MTVGATVILGLVLLLPGQASGESESSFGAEGRDHAIEVTGDRGGRNPASVGEVTPTAAAPTYDTHRRPVAYCGQTDRGSSAGSCIDAPEGAQVRRQCTDGTTATDPLFRRELDATGRPVGPWEQVDNGGCPEDPTTPVILSAADFRRLPLAPSTPGHQPADGRNLIGKDVLLFTDPTPQTLTTTVLGVPVTVRATPTTYTWDLGDGTAPLTTTDPGAPYPDHTVARAYTEPGTYTLTLTTTWTGQYQVNGTGPWLDVAGTATTTSPPVTLTAEEAPSRLVADR